MRESDLTLIKLLLIALSSWFKSTDLYQQERILEDLHIGKMKRNKDLIQISLSFLLANHM